MSVCAHRCIPRHGRGKTFCLKKSSWWLWIYYKAGQIWADLSPDLSPDSFSEGGSGLVKLTMRQKAFTFRLGKSVGSLDLLCLKCLDVAHNVADALLHLRIVKPVQRVKQRAPNRHVR